MANYREGGTTPHLRLVFVQGAQLWVGYHSVMKTVTNKMGGREEGVGSMSGAIIILTRGMGEPTYELLLSSHPGGGLQYR